MGWEFLAQLDKKSLDQGPVFYKFKSEVGPKIYNRSIITSDFPLFLQINNQDFSELQKRGYIRNVLSLDDFISELDKNEELDYNLDDKTLNEEDLSLNYATDDDNLYLGSGFQLEMVSIPIEEPLREYHVQKIGISDVIVEGRYNDKLFENVTISNGFFREENIFGMEFITSFSEFVLGKYENDFATFGFIE